MIEQNIRILKDEISRLCSQIGRRQEEITIVAVSKGRPAEKIKEALDAGILDIGENRVQEAAAKFKILQTPNSGERIIKRHFAPGPVQAEGAGSGFMPEGIRWHFIGHLQTNKVKEAVRFFDLIHSVDSVRLAEEIDKEADKIDKIQDILIEVKTSQEATKFGFGPEEAIKAVTEMAKFKNLKISGLMTIAPVVDDPEKARPNFCLLRELKDKINKLRAPGSKLQILSMGMSDDFKIAIEEGSTMVRLGRVIFSRP